MFTIIVLLLVGAGVYVGWFHKFSLEDGTEVKGWVAKYKAEHNANPLDNPKEAFNDIVASVKEEGKKKKEERSSKVESGEPKVEKGVESGELRVERSSKEESGEPREESGMVASSGRKPTEDNPSGLSITSTPLEFEEVLQEAQADPFEKGWNLMSGYFGWLLLGASRNDLINRDNIWAIMSNACKYFKDGLMVDYKDLIAKGESTEDDLWIMPAWMVNAHLLNGIGFFGERMSQYFSGEEYERIKAWYDALAQDRTERTKGPNTQITDEPNAAFWLAELFTILRGEDDAMIEYNRTEYFEVTSDFDIYLPQPKVEGGISEK